jgi:hypothetical protein
MGARSTRTPTSVLRAPSYELNSSMNDGKAVLSLLRFKLKVEVFKVKGQDLQLSTLQPFQLFE